MWTDLPSPDHSGEDIHEQSDIDEASLETDVGNIGHPDLILSRDLKGLNSIDPRVSTFKGSCGLTDTFHRYREILFFHQPSHTFIPHGVSLTQ